MGRERSNSFLLNCDHEREDCKCRMKGKRNEASQYVFTSLLHRDKSHGIKERKKQKQKTTTTKEDPPPFPKLVTKMKLYLFSSVTWAQNWEILVFYSWYHRLFGGIQLKCRKRTKHGKEPNKRVISDTENLYISIFSQWYFQLQICLVDHILFTYSKHSKHYFVFSSQKETAFNGCLSLIFEPQLGDHMLQYKHVFWKLHQFKMGGLTRRFLWLCSYACFSDLWVIF